MCIKMGKEPPGLIEKTSTPPVRRPALREEFEGISTIKEIQPVPEAQRRRSSLGQGIILNTYRNRLDSSEEEGDSHLAVLRRRRGED
jgi:hypothetical protein